MNKRQLKKAHKQAQGGGWPRRVRLLPANHPERAKWWNRHLDAVHRFLCAIYPWDGHQWAQEEVSYLFREESIGGTQLDMAVGDRSHFTPWSPVYYSGDARRAAEADLIARAAGDDMPDEIPF